MLHDAAADRRALRLRFEDLAPASMSQAVRTAALDLAREPQFVRADGTIVALEQKDALLLAYLAIEGPTPRSRLAALLWPDVDPERARANLRQRLFRLRKALGRELLEGSDVAGLCADIEVRLDPPDAKPGELLRGLAEPVGSELADWLALAREQRRAGRIRALADESNRLESAGRLVAALAAAERLLDLRPDLRARPSPPDAPALPARRPGGGAGRVRPLLRRAGADPRRRPRCRDRGAARARRRQQPAGRCDAAAAATGQRAAAAASDRPRRRVAAPARRLVGRAAEPGRR